MATPLANFFTRVGFEVDTTSLNKLNSTFTDLQKKISGMSKAMQTPTQRMQERLNVAAMKTELSRLELKNAKIFSNVEGIKQEVRQRERVARQDDAQKKHSMFMEKSQARQLGFIAKAQELAARAQMKATPYATRGSASQSPSGGGQTGSTAAPFFTTDNVQRIAQLEAGRRFVQSAFRVGNFQTAQMPQYEFLTGSTEGAQQSIGYVNKLVDDLKLNLQETNAQFVQFLGATRTTIGVEKTQQTFKTLQTFGVMMGATGDQLKRGTKAVQQMLSKQKLSAEELTGQMAEANLIPGATQVFADVLEGGDVKKLFDNMQKGKYELQDIVNVLDSLESKIKKDQLDQMLQRPTAELTELNTAWQRFLEEVNKEGGLKLMRFVLDLATDGVNILRKAIKPLGTVFERAWSYAKNLWDMLFAVGNLLGGLFFKNVGSTILTLTLLGLSLNKILPPLMKVAKYLNLAKYLKAAGIAAFILLLDDLIVAMQGGNSVLGDLAKGDGWPSVLAKTLIGIGQTVEFILGNVIALIHGISTGDWGYFFEVWRKFGDDLNQLMPFDKWMTQLKHFAKLLLATTFLLTNKTNPLAYRQLFDAYKNYETFNSIQNAKVGIPEMLARQTNAQTNTTPSINFNPSIIINGSGLNQTQLETAVGNVLTKQMTQAKANYVMAR